MRKWLPILSIIVVVGVIIFASLPNNQTRCGSSHCPDTSVIKNKSAIKTHIYLENSGSMDGLVTINTTFKDALEHLMVMINNKYGVPELSFINNKVYDVDSTKLSKDISLFCHSLTPKSIKVGAVGSSNINVIFDTILKRTTDNNVSILVSDCVYSIKGSDAATLLSHEKNLTLNAFMQAIDRNKGDLAAIILQCQSNFDGYYYDMSNNEIRYKGYRPYYIIMMGKTELLKDIYSNIDLTKSGVDGLTNSYLVSSDGIRNDVANSCIITDPALLSNVRRIEPGRRSLNIEDISVASSPFQLAVGFARKNLFVDDAYLKDKDNYEINPEDASLTKIAKVDVNSSAYGDCVDFKDEEPYYLLMSFKNIPQRVSVSLKYNVPEWAYSCSTSNDYKKVPSSNVTFGISYMLEGITEAFREKSASKSIMNIDFGIKQ